MINAGDRFTHHDLRQSINELCHSDMHKYLQNGAYGVAVGDTLMVPAQISPHEYAAACIREYQDISSSAINLDTQLRDLGFKTTRRFAHKYKNLGLSSQQIIHDAYCLDWFHQIYQTATPRKKYQTEYIQLLDDAFRTSYYYAQYLWALNWRVCNGIAGQLKTPSIEQWKQIIGAILGVGFQFHPDDVYEYSIKHVAPNISKSQFNARYAEQLEFKNQMKTNYGIDTGCLVLSPASREKLQKIVTHTDTPYWLQIIKNLIPGHNR